MQVPKLLSPWLTNEQWQALNKGELVTLCFGEDQVSLGMWTSDINRLAIILHPRPKQSFVRSRPAHFYGVTISTALLYFFVHHEKVFRQMRRDWRCFELHEKFYFLKGH